ncbi:NAD(P)-binding domain-containing protein [Nonomuraea africana]|uniref:Dinucleotide-binding enzyme n=1 Tax=Nonomuraea africana TaxID=46171 RepID=A0ABR9KG59_9ACTN|nr:NAD(P)-binding domain-containing protein [Nonomuraea africana]MBE1561008.1 putative dinucleotide-binding enzyme [Nonomuraea africana]
MRIGILGAGGMADALGTQWTRAGHEVMTSGRSSGSATQAMGYGSFSQAMAYGEAVLLAVPAHAALEVADDSLRGKVLIDCTNPIRDGELTADHPMAERVAAATGARVVKAFNLCHVDVWRMTPPVFGGRPLAVPLCGDDEEALTVVRGLVADLGCTPFDGGGLARAALLEATAAFMIGLWFKGLDAQAIAPPL